MAMDTDRKPMSSDNNEDLPFYDDRRDLNGNALPSEKDAAKDASISENPSRVRIANDAAKEKQWQDTPQQDFRRSRDDSIQRDIQSRPTELTDDGDDDGVEETASYEKTWWKFKMRGYDDDMSRDWWFASTAIPLFAATIAPFANVTSIAALVTYWRQTVGSNSDGNYDELYGPLIQDPRWAYWTNVGSLICGFIGNIFLLFNFTGRVRYIIALPATIVFFYAACFMLTGLTAAMAVYSPPGIDQTWSHGYRYAVISAALYFVCAMILMINMLGYFLGHYPQHFDLTDSQRTLILQTMMFFVWLAGGAAVFSAVEDGVADTGVRWTFVNALYFCDVTILTVGFGDLVPSTDLGRGLVLPYSVFGIIFLGLVISSIAKFASELSEDKVIKKHMERSRDRTVSRAISEPDQIRKVESLQPADDDTRGRLTRISSPFNPMRLRGNIGFSVYNRRDHCQIASLQRRRSSSSHPVMSPIRNRKVVFDATKHKAKKLVILRDEKDRFDAMRKIQLKATKFKHYYALTLSVTAFSTLWCVGAVVFWRTETHVQGLSYFQALYFCYVSLLTIGYGDLAPKSNAGRAFFVLWSLIAVPTITILINDLGSTVISSFKKASFRVADFTLLPKKGVWREWLEAHPRLLGWIQRRKDEHDAKKRLKEGMKYPGEPGGEPSPIDLEREATGLEPDLEILDDEIRGDEAHKPRESNDVLARRLAVAIRSVAGHMKEDDGTGGKQYTFEEWAEITRLIRFTTYGTQLATEEEETDGVLEWDWLGENSPMVIGQTEPEFVLDRLCESLGRYMRRVERGRKRLREAGLIKGESGLDIDFNASDDVDRADHWAEDGDPGGVAARDWGSGAIVRQRVTASSSSGGNASSSTEVEDRDRSKKYGVG